MSIREVAARAKVSTATASRVLSKADYPVKEETRQRVVAAADELNYSRNDLARGLLLKRTNTMGLILPDLSNAIYAQIASGVGDVASANDLAVIISTTDHAADKFAISLRVLRQKRVDGIVVAGGATRDRIEGHYLQGQMSPMVVVGQYHTDLPTVRVDNRGGTYKLVEHLVALGHRRIGFIAGLRGSVAVQDRLDAYRRALRKHEIPVDDSIVFAGDFTEEAGFQAALTAFQLDNRPTAIIASNDRMAIGVLSAAHRRGVKIPDDLAVAGFDDIPMASYTHPPLTTVSQPQYEIGASAMKLLLELLSGEGGHRTRIDLPTKLIIRQSTSRDQD